MSIGLAVAIGVGLVTAPSLATASPAPTWALSQEFSSALDAMAGVSCPTASVCFALATGPAMVLKSSDGGNTWAEEI